MHSKGMAGQPLPRIFLWTKMGYDARQGVEPIIRRKELERQAGGGVFWWGIGETRALRSIHEMRKREKSRTVVFTKTRQPKQPKKKES